MTILARRRLQLMLDQLAPVLAQGKGKDILSRLNHPKNVEQALPAEMELALLWAIHSLGDLEIEPEWWGDLKRPDAITDTLVPGRTVAIEIAATNDNAISGEEAMDTIALQISAAANGAQKGVGSFLYFTFREESGYLDGRYIRRRLAPKDFTLADSMSRKVQDWVLSGRSVRERLRLQGAGLDVEVQREAYRQTRYHNFHSSMPPETHSLDDNPLFDLLRRKKRQLKAATPGTLRIIFVADVGSTLLRRIGQVGERDWTNRRVSGSQIITHFMDTYRKDVDAVVAFSPFKELSSFGFNGLSDRKPRRWNVTFYGSPALPEPPDGLQRVAEMLPEPHYEGYQARSLFRQGAFSTTGRGQYLGMTIKSTTGLDDLRVEFPARMLLDLLAGRITEEQFRRQLDRPGSKNIFEHWLSSGMTISRAEMAPRDMDEDDDHIVLYFSDDPAVRPFKLPEG
ncbi:MAG: hypothetical protein K2W86_09195 [Sphingomonas sp.]|uniref:hypothetical protein n=1 Tax=Sphingomonas sp. TaxID=28214 RepID=UPI0035A8B82A|nr:hypothetical protein [Sphingomonas sp.]